jgi:hypothetical protein
LGVSGKIGKKEKVPETDFGHLFDGRRLELLQKFGKEKMIFKKSGSFFSRRRSHIHQSPYKLFQLFLGSLRSFLHATFHISLDNFHAGLLHGPAGCGKLYEYGLTLLSFDDHALNPSKLPFHSFKPVEHGFSILRERIDLVRQGFLYHPFEPPYGGYAKKHLHCICNLSCRSIQWYDILCNADHTRGMMSEGVPLETGFFGQGIFTEGSKKPYCGRYVSWQ